MSDVQRLSRHQLLRWLTERIHTPEGGGACLMGADGIGRTHLLFELYHRLRSQPELLVGAARFESLEEPPFFPLFGALGELFGTLFSRTRLGLELLVDGLPKGREALGRAMVRLALALGSPTGNAEPGSRWRLREAGDAFALVEKAAREESRTCEEVLAFLLVRAAGLARERSHAQRMVIIVDQVENAGRLALWQLQQLLNQPASVCQVIVSLGERDPLWSPPLPPGLGQLPMLELTGPSPEELLELYSHTVQVPERAMESRELLFLSGGKPLAVRFLALAHRFGTPWVASEPYSAGYLEPLLRLLAPPAKELLGLLALTPGPLPLGRLDWAELLKVDVSTLDPMVRSLIQQGFLGTFPRALVFTHPRFRTIVRGALSQEERAMLGARLARFLETQSGRDISAGCGLPVLGAWHAGLEASGALEAGTRAGLSVCESWLELGEWEQALLHAEPLCAREGVLQGDELARIHQLMGLAAHALGRWGTAEAAFDRAAGKALEVGEAELADVASLNLGGVALERGDPALAEKRLSTWLKEASSHPLRWRALYQLGVAQARDGRIEEGVVSLDKAVEAAREVGLEEEALKLEQEVAELVLADGQLEAGMRRLRQGIEDAKAAGLRLQQAGMVGQLATVCEVMGQASQAEHWWKEGLGLLQEDGQSEMLWCTLSNSYGSFLHRRGRREEAVKLLQRALEVAQASGKVAMEGKLLNSLAMLCESMGAFQLALDHARQSLKIQTRLGDARGLAVVKNNLGSLLFALREYDEAARELEEGLELWRQLSDPRGEAICLNNLAMLYERREEHGQALQAYEESLSLKRVLGDPGAERETLSNLVTYLDGQRRYARAEEYLRELISLDRGLGHPQVGLEERYLATLREKARGAEAMR